MKTSAAIFGVTNSAYSQSATAPHVVADHRTKFSFTRADIDTATQFGPKIKTLHASAIRDFSSQRPNRYRHASKVRKRNQHRAFQSHEGKLT